MSSYSIELKKAELFSVIDDESNMMAGASQLYNFPMCALIQIGDMVVSKPKPNEMNIIQEAIKNFSEDQ